MKLTINKRRATRLKQAIECQYLVIFERWGFSEKGKHLYHVYKCEQIELEDVVTAMLSTRERRKIKTKKFNDQSVTYFLENEETLTTLDDLRRDKEALQQLQSMHDLALRTGRTAKVRKIIKKLAETGEVEL